MNDMDIENLMAFSRAARELIGSHRPTAAQFDAVAKTLARLYTDATGQPVEFAFTLPETRPPKVLPGQIDMNEVWHVPSVSIEQTGVEP